jgi:catechol 2,3-dioxygenase-like lactoylglutathione lyase family enzyme
VSGARGRQEETMAIGRLDHYSIRTTKLGETRRFYTDVVGLTDGHRPDFDFPGAWLYIGDRAVVHVVGIDPDNPQGLLEYLGQAAVDAEGTGTIDHIAFVATDYDGMAQRLSTMGVRYRERGLPAFNLRQMFLEDPNGVTIELNFSTEPARV